MSTNQLAPVDASAVVSAVAPTPDVRPALVDAPTCREQCEARYRWKTECPNMKGRENDRDMSGDNYDCKVCGEHVWLDYEEMK